MNLDALRRNWEALGREDPLWAVLADPAKRGNRWQPEEFYATGRADVAAYLRDVADLGLALGAETALDFGCGAGRLTQALSEHFGRVVGVDVAEAMTDLARAENTRRNPHAGRVGFVANPEPDLAFAATGSFDLVLSIVVLQHMSNDLKSGYLAEFVRLLRPGGLAVFTVPARARRSPAGLVRRSLPNPLLNVYRRRRYGLTGVMEFHTMGRAAVERVVGAAGGVVHAVLDDPMAGPPWESHLYVVGRAPGSAR